MSTFQASHIETNVQKAIVKKIQALNRLSLSDDKETNFFSTAKTLEPTDNQNPLEYHLVRNTLCRLSVDIPVEGEEKNKVLFFSSYINPGSERYGKKTQANRHLTFNKNPFTKDKNFIWRGDAGITGVQVTQKSFFVKQLTVNWTCPDPNDFEKIIKPAFLKHGRFMVLEFGWGISGKGESFPEITTNNMSDYMTELRKRNAKSVESYQAECGIVTSYGYDVNEQGGYSGTITITSRGDNILGTTIQNTDTDETVTRFTPIKNVDAKERAENITTNFKQVIESLTEYALKFSGGLFQSDEYDLEQTSFKKGALNISSTKVDGVKPFSGTFVSWGWFEDHILNSFFKIDVTPVGKKDKIPFQEFRSVHTTPYEPDLSPTNITGLSSELNQDLINSRALFSGFTDETTGESLKVFPDGRRFNKLISNQCNNVKGLYSLGLDTIILPGQHLDVRDEVFEQLKEGVQNSNKNDTNYKKWNDNIINKSYSGPLSLIQKYTSDLVNYWMQSDDQRAADTSNSEQLKNIKEQLDNDDKVMKSFELIDKFFKPFGKPEQLQGNIRNFVFNTEYLKSHFEGINSVEEGISSLWSDVSAKYGGFFKFGYHQDENNNGRIAVVDFNYQNDLEKRVELISDRETLNFQKYIEGRASIHGEKMWQFGLFSKDSIVKDFSLSLQLTKEAATLAMYGTGVNGRFINQSSLPDLGIERFAALSNSEIYKKLHPSGSTTLAQEKGKGNQVVINDFSSPVDGEDDTMGLSIETYDKNSTLIEELVPSDVDFKEIEAVKTSVEKIKKRNKAKGVYGDLNFNIAYGDDGSMGEDMKRKMLSTINYSDVEGIPSNYQLNKTIIPIELTMTIDGVGGLRPGNLFRVDYLPKIYRDYTYFQIFTIGHTINTSGWSTSIGAKMKLDFPKMIKDGLIGLDSETPLTKPERPQVPTMSVESEDDELLDDFVIEETTLDEFETWEAPAPPPAPPRPIIPTIDDPYDEELEQDLVIEETTLDDFEPWETPAPFVAAKEVADIVVEIAADAFSRPDDFELRRSVDVVEVNDKTTFKENNVKVPVKKKELNTTRTYTEEELAIPTTIEEIKEKFGSTLSFRQDSGGYFINNKKVSQFEYMVVDRVYKDYFNEFVGIQL